MSTPAGTTETGAQLRAFLANDWRAWLAHYPEIATAIGAPGQNDRWTDESETGRVARREHLAHAGRELATIDRQRLAPTDRFSYDLYHRMIQNAEEGVSLGFDPIPFDLGEPAHSLMPLNQMDGIHLTAAAMMEIAPRDRVRDFDDRLARLRALPTAVDHVLEILDRGVRAGYSPPHVGIARVPDQVRNLIPAEPMESGLLEPFKEFPSMVGPGEQSRLRAEAVTVYRDRVVPAFEKLHRYLTDRYVAACRTTVGASALPDGARLYAYLARRNTTTDLSPQQIHEIGLAEVARLRTEMESIMRRSGFTGSFAEFCQWLKTDPKFFWPTAEALVDGYRVIGKKADPQLCRLFGRLPRLPYGILPVPAYREASSPGAYYQPGAATAGRPGYFYANTHLIGTRPKWEMEALALHEAVPGHHLQIAISQELADLPDFRRETGPTSFIEGWGLYAESLGEELGFYQDPYSKFGQLGYDIWRSIRLVVDTGMHALGWSRERAVQLFRENTGQSDDAIGVEIDRYIVWPGQALAYKIGQLKFRELRTLSERTLGERFDVRAFHDLVLGEGAVPLREVEARVKAWIASRTAAG